MKNAHTNRHEIISIKHDKNFESLPNSNRTFISVKDFLSVYKEGKSISILIKLIDKELKRHDLPGELTIDVVYDTNSELETTLFPIPSAQIEMFRIEETILEAQKRCIERIHSVNHLISKINANNSSHILLTNKLQEERTPNVEFCACEHTINTVRDAFEAQISKQSCHYLISGKTYRISRIEKHDGLYESHFEESSVNNCSILPGSKFSKWHLNFIENQKYVNRTCILKSDICDSILRESALIQSKLDITYIPMRKAISKLDGKPSQFMILSAKPSCNTMSIAA